MDCKLKELLRRWDKAITFPEASNKRLHDKIMNAVRNGQKTSRGSAPADCFIIPRKLFYGLASAAAILLVAVPSVVWLSFSGVEDSGSGGFAQTSIISGQEIAEIRTLYSRVNVAFDNNIRWLVIEDGKMRFAPREGAFASCKNAESSEQLVLIRQVVVRKSGDKLERVFTADIVTSPGEVVSFDGQGGDSYFWVEQAGPGIFAVEGEYRIKANGEHISMRYSSGQQTDVTTVLKKVSTMNHEYIVLQSVSAI